jgi:predicted O-methyltransferase YrrM
MGVAIAAGAPRRARNRRAPAAVFRRGVKGQASRLGRTRLGRSLIHAAVLDDPGEQRLAHVEQWPTSLSGFEDLVFLFSSNQLNHGIASLQLDEAALLFRVAREAGPGTLAEIGRFRGGSTLITATAMHRRAELWSYDLHVALRPDLPGDLLDRELLDALRRYGLASRVHLVVGDSHTAELPAAPLVALFVDGDHAYEGARADYERWRDLIAPGGHLLFHDAVDRGRFGSYSAGVARLVAAIERERDFERLAGAGSIAHFVRRS